MAATPLPLPLETVVDRLIQREAEAIISSLRPRVEQVLLDRLLRAVGEAEKVVVPPGPLAPENVQVALEPDAVTEYNGARQLSDGRWRCIRCSHVSNSRRAATMHNTKKHKRRTRRKMRG